MPISQDVLKREIFLGKYIALLVGRVSHRFLINLRFMWLNHGPFIYFSDSLPIYLFVWSMSLLLYKSSHFASDSTYIWPVTKPKRIFICLMMCFTIDRCWLDSFFGSHGSFGSAKGSNFAKYKTHLGNKVASHFLSQNFIECNRKHLELLDCIQNPKML